MAVNIQGTLAANGTFPLADTSEIKGGLIQAVDLVALENYANIERLSVGQIGVANDTQKAYILTIIGAPPGTPHAWEELIAGTRVTQDQKDALDNAANALTAANPVYDTTTANAALSAKVDKTTTVNGQALSSNVTITKTDVGLGNVTNDAQVTQLERADLTTSSSNLIVSNGTNAVIGAGTSIDIVNERQLAHTINNEVITGNKHYINNTKIGLDSNQMLYASYLATINADYAINDTTATASGGAEVVDAWLDLAHNDNRYIAYNNYNNADSTQVDIISLCMTIRTNYSDAPSNPQVLMSIYSGTTSNKIQLMHSNINGTIELFLYDDARTLIYGGPISLGDWLPIALTTYDIKLIINYAANTVSIYIDNQIFGEITDLPSATVLNTWTSVHIGQDAETAIYTSNIYYANVGVVRGAVEIEQLSALQVKGTVQLIDYAAASTVDFVQIDNSGYLQTASLTISGDNTGDETTQTIKTKLGAASLSQDGYLTSIDYNKMYPIISDYGTLENGDTLVYNGSNFVSQKAQSLSGAAVIYYCDPAVIHGPSGDNAILVRSLAYEPVDNNETTDTTNVTQSDGLKIIAAYKSPKMVSKVFSGGRWEFTLKLSTSNITVDSYVGTSGFNGFYDFATCEITGVGTTRTLTIISGGEFLPSDYNAALELTSYIETPQGLYKIVGFTDPTTLIIETPDTYINENNVTINLWRNIYYQLGDDDITHAIPGTYWHAVTSPTIVNDDYNFFGLLVLATTTSATSVSISMTYGTNQLSSYVTSPFSSDHNNLPGKQGGGAGEYYHLTLAQYNTITSLPVSYVTSFNGRTGAVNPQAGDYSAAQVGAQAANLNLDSLSLLTYTATAHVKMTAANTFTLDTNTYLPVIISTPETGQTIKRNGSGWINAYPELLSSAAGALDDVVITIVSDTDRVIYIPASNYILYTTDDYSGEPRRYSLAAANLTINHGINYIYVDYNGGTPIFAYAQTAANINGSNRVLIDVIFVDGINVFTYNFYSFNKSRIKQDITGVINRAKSADKYRIISGLELSTSGTNIVISAGEVWDGTRLVSLPAFNSSNIGQNDNYAYIYTGATWTYLKGVKDLRTLSYSYQTATGEANLSVGNYAVHWIFRDISTDLSTDAQIDRVYIFLGRGDYNLGAALNETTADLFNNPAIPQDILDRSILVGKVVIGYNASIAARVISSVQAGNYISNQLVGTGRIDNPLSIDYNNLVQETELVDAPTIAWDLAAHPRAYVNLTANRTLGTPTNISAGQYYSLRVTQGATAYTLDLDIPGIKWQNDTPPQLQTIPFHTDILSFEARGGTIQNTPILYGTIKRFG